MEIVTFKYSIVFKVCLKLSVTKKNVVELSSWQGKAICIDLHKTTTAEHDINYSSIKISVHSIKHPCLFHIKCPRKFPVLAINSFSLKRNLLSQTRFIIEDKLSPFKILLHFLVSQNIENMPF